MTKASKILLPAFPGSIPSMPQRKPAKEKCDHFFEISMPSTGYARTYFEVTRVSGKSEVYHGGKLTLSHCPLCGLSRSKLDTE